MHASDKWLYLAVGWGSLNLDAEISDSADVTKVATGRQQMKQPVADYDPADIYNFDETGLFYKLGPNGTLATCSVSGTEASKERIAVGLATNATGTHKLFLNWIHCFINPHDSFIRPTSLGTKVCG